VPIVARSPRFISNIFIGEERSMADPKGSKAMTTVGGASVQARSTIAVAMEDLAEANRKELEKELEEEMAERRRKKLACFQKTHHGIVKKADTAAASGTKMDSPLSLEDLVQLVDISAASKYGFTPKGRARVYQKPYPEYFDMIPYPRGSRGPDFMKFNGDDNRTTYEHIGQFLAQVNDVGITDVHKIRLFPLSLSGTAFNWFTSLALNSINTWPCLEKKFHNYFYNGLVELRLSDLTSVRQKYNESMSEYLKRFRETRNMCYNLTIGEKDLADLAFAGLMSHLKEKMEGHDFVDVNQVLQWAVGHENHVRDHKPHSRFRDVATKEREK
jgi:hypothetical protein